MIRRIHCFVADCDDCHEPFEHSDLGYTVHFDTDHDALDYLTDNAWTITPDGHLRCQDCSARHLCRQLDHLWGFWQICRCRGTIPAHSVAGCDFFRTCAQCGEIDVSTFADLPTTEPNQPDQNQPGR